MCVDVLDRQVATEINLDKTPAMPEIKEEVRSVDEESSISRMADNGERR